MSRKERYKDAPKDISDAIEKGRIITDLIPEPDQLVRRKKSITMRVDEDVLEWYKSLGKGYQTRINRVLRSYMEAHQNQ